MELINKPWGDEKIFAVNKKCSVKILRVTPGNSLSTQYHNIREEMTYFLTDGYFELEGKTMKMKKGDIIITKIKQPHRLFAKDKEVQVLEISTGDYDPEDIVRLKDFYGREGTTKV